MPADILLYALIAAGLIFWLKNIIGTEDEDEKGSKKPSIFGDDQEDGHQNPVIKGQSSNVVNLDALVGGAAIMALPRHVRIDNKTTENRLEDLSKKYESFDLTHFVSGAEQAFPMIIEAFAEGDLETLENLLAEPVYHAFEAVVQERETRGETVETTVKSVEKMDITEAQLKDDMLFITVRFTAREICVIRDKEGAIIAGDPDKVTEMVDVWVFGREIEADTPIWHLYETRDDEIEDHKTPMPEAGSANKAKSKKSPSKKTKTQDTKES